MSPGLYRSTDGRIIKVLYTRGDPIHYWDIPDIAKADCPIGKLKQSMPLAVFNDAGFAPLDPAK